MPRRREYPLIRRCPHDGCKEVSMYSYSTRKSYNEARKRYERKEWFCSRHDPNGGNLSPKNLEESGELIIECVHPDAKKYPRIKDHHTWTTGSGFATGVISHIPWNAHAEDFPIGTKVIVETRVKVILPEADNVEPNNISSSNDNA